jgi:environmental stress-induced protein Ves
MKILAPADYRSMPWKNGAGTTIEIAVFPEHAGLNDFAWRVSRAQVVADGGFSHFAGIDRSLALLHGAGMRLTQDGVSQQVDAHNNIARFPGDVPVHAELVDGAISDFNLMSRRTVCAHQLNHWIGQATHALPDHAVLLYCAQGTGKLIADNAMIEIQTDATVLFSSEDNLAGFSLQCAEHSRFYCVQII